MTNDIVLGDLPSLHHPEEESISEWQPWNISVQATVNKNRTELEYSANHTQWAFTLNSPDPAISGAIWNGFSGIKGFFHGNTTSWNINSIEGMPSCVLISPALPAAAGTIMDLSNDAVQPAMISKAETEETATDFCDHQQEFMVCGVGTSEFCDTLTTPVAFDKMATIIFSAYSTFNSQTAVQMSTAWLLCYSSGDPFHDSPTSANQVLDDFKANAEHHPSTNYEFMHLFQTVNLGGVAECPGQWSIGSYSSATQDISDFEYNIFLHELGHNFQAEHETHPNGASNPCGQGVAHADELLTTTLLIENELLRPLKENYSIMHGTKPDSEKQRVFTDGGNNNVQSDRNNVCIINARASQASSPTTALPTC